MKEKGIAWKLGMFVIIGLALFVLAIYFVGKQKNIFGGTFNLQAQFKSVNGLKVGNNIRFAGIDIGTVSAIELMSDTSVIVEMTIKNDIHKFIKTDAKAGIGSDGLMGDKVLTLYSGNTSLQTIQDNAFVSTRNALEIEDIMRSVKTSVDNAGIITAQLAQFTYKMNNGKGALSKLITDESFSESLKATLANLETSSEEFAKFTIKMNNNKGALSKLMSDEKLGNKIDSTITNLQSGTKGLSENMEAAKKNIFFRGYFKSKKKAEDKKKADEKKKVEERKKKDSLEKKQ